MNQPNREDDLQVLIFAITRHRLGTDGQGVTTLVCFHGCPLHCEYCINPECWRIGSNYKLVTPKELLDHVKIDNLYFTATGGGITFGGGEPAIRSEFIEAFRQIAPAEWRFNIETSLNVERHHVERLLPCIDQYFIDIKDVNPVIYKRYTRRDNQCVLDNLQWLLSHEGLAERIIVRLPLIKDYNTLDDLRRSREYLESMGVKRFDEFEYQCDYKRSDHYVLHQTMGVPRKSLLIETEEVLTGGHLKFILNDLWMIFKILFILGLIYYAIQLIVSWL